MNCMHRLHLCSHAIAPSPPSSSSSSILIKPSVVVRARVDCFHSSCPSSGGASFGAHGLATDLCLRVTCHGYTGEPTRPVGGGWVSTCLLYACPYISVSVCLSVCVCVSLSLSLSAVLSDSRYVRLSFEAGLSLLISETPRLGQRCGALERLSLLGKSSCGLPTPGQKTAQPDTRGYSRNFFA